MPARHLELDYHTPLIPEDRLGYVFADDEFDRAYPDPVQRLSRCHWTPVEVGRKAAEFLVSEPGTRVLDVGCGPGKFCAIGAATTEGRFTGVEQRGHLVSTARRMLRSYRIPRVEIIHANVMELSFEPFDAFYLYNPFQENVFPALCIDTEVELQPGLYQTYARYVCAQLSRAPAGTRVVTFWGNDEEIPFDYVCQDDAYDGKLKFWIKREARPTDYASHLPSLTTDLT